MFRTRINRSTHLMSVFIVAWGLCWVSPVVTAQAPAGHAMPSVPAATEQPITGIVQPALDAVRQTLQALHTDKWKKGSVREEAGANIDSIQNDIRNNLPSLLQKADAGSGTVTALLPLSRHLGALYDVLLRVTEASRIAAPDDQTAQLQQVLLRLSTARLALDDRMQGSAGALEKQVVDLRSTVQKQAAQIADTPTPVALPCVPPPPAMKATPKRKRTAKPTETAKPAASKPAQPTASH